MDSIADEMRNWDVDKWAENAESAVKEGLLHGWHAVKGTVNSANMFGENLAATGIRLSIGEGVGQDRFVLDISVYGQAGPTISDNGLFGVLLKWREFHKLAKDIGRWAEDRGWRPEFNIIGKSEMSFGNFQMRLQASEPGGRWGISAAISVMGYAEVAAMVGRDFAGEWTLWAGEDYWPECVETLEEIAAEAEQQWLSEYGDGG